MLDFLVFPDTVTMKNHRSHLTALTLIFFLREVKEPIALFKKSRGRRSWWCGQPFLGWVVYL